MTESVLVPGNRDVRASLDLPERHADSTADGTASTASAPGACVVACPPHPQLGGDRHDRRLTALSTALTERAIACLRIDYGTWDEGHGERRDARNAVSWAADRYDRVGLFGYSFGGCIALLAAAGRSDISAVTTLAPASRLADDLDAVDALDAIDCPVQIVYGERDETVDWEPVVERARALALAVESYPADHHFVGQHDAIAATLGEFLAARLDHTGRQND